MSMTDPIADFLARIRNGIRARKQRSSCPRSNIKLRIAEILRDEGFVQTVSTGEDNKQGMLKLELRYDGRASASGCAITGMRRVSRPGQRAYVPAKRRPEGPQWPRHRHPLHVAGRDDRPRGARQGRRRRGPLRGLVSHVAHRT